LENILSMRASPVGDCCARKWRFYCVFVWVLDAADTPEGASDGNLASSAFAETAFVRCRTSAISCGRCSLLSFQRTDAVKRYSNGGPRNAWSRPIPLEHLLLQMLGITQPLLAGRMPEEEERLSGLFALPRHRRRGLP